MADYAGAVAAIKARLAANWTTTPIRYQNDRDPPEWPPTDPNSGLVTPWLFLEVISNQSSIRAAGVPGDNIWLTEGHILIHVVTPIGDGAELAQQYAVAAGEIFRAATFYNDGQGSKVLSGVNPAPRTDGGGTDADKGNWFRVTMTCGFEFFHRG